MEYNFVINHLKYDNRLKGDKHIEQFTGKGGELEINDDVFGKKSTESDSIFGTWLKLLLTIF